ncbi:MAG: phage tail protein [Solobacterium sp.]|nr:phage tail protein [Solobacterium sp.]
MIFIYEANETAFTSNGLGPLPDLTVCEVSEELNGIFEVYAECPITGRNADQIAVDRIMKVAPDDSRDPQPFRIYSVEETLDGYSYMIYAQHISYDLSDQPVAPFETIGVVPALTGLVNNCMLPTQFTTWTDIVNTDTAFTLDEIRSFRACIGGVRGSILDQFGGEFEFDRFTVKLHAHRGADNGVYIRYAKNLDTFSNEREIEAWTGCVAFYKDDDVTVSGTIQYIEGHEEYAREKIFILDASEDFDEPPTPEDLNARAVQYMTANDFGLPFTDTLKMSFVPLWQTDEYKGSASIERVSLGDTVHVVYRVYDVAMKVIGVVWDALRNRYKEITLGKKKATFGDTIKQIAEGTQQGAIDQAVSIMDAALDHAADVIAGGTGGYIVIGRNAAGQPNEIYIMDSPDMGTAVNVMRMNYAGIAFSQTGINGTYTTCWTIESDFVADTITTGHLNGNLITAGSILTSALEAAIQTVIDGIKMNFSFLNDGLHISQKDESGTIVGTYQTIVSDLGLRVIETASNTSVLVAEQDTVMTKNLTSNQYLRVQTEYVTGRFQQFYSTAHNEHELACYWEV